MGSSPGCLISHTDEKWFRRGKYLNQGYRHRKTGGDVFARSLELCVVGMSTVMARRTLFEQVGIFNEDLPCCEDYDLWLRASAHHDFLYVDEPLTIKNGGRPDQVSARYRVGMDKYRIASMLNLLRSQRLDSKKRELAMGELARKCGIYGNGCLRHGRREEGRRYLDIAAAADAGRL